MSNSKEKEFKGFCLPSELIIADENDQTANEEIEKQRREFILGYVKYMLQLKSDRQWSIEELLMSIAKVRFDGYLQLFRSHKEELKELVYNGK